MEDKIEPLKVFVLLLPAEYKIPLAEGDYVLMFADARNVWGGLSKVELDSRDDLKKGAGFGVRIDIPMGNEASNCGAAKPSQSDRCSVYEDAMLRRPRK